MTWLIRDVDNGGGGIQGTETPDYGGNTDLFTIKLHIGGNFSSNPKAYVGGEIRYVDKCDTDELSLLEVFTMLTECGVNVGMCELFFKLPKSAMEFGLCPLNSDSHVVEMCKLVEGSRLMYVFCETSEETQASQFPYTQCEYYVDPTPSIEFEKNQLKDLFQLERITEDMYNIDTLLGNPIVEEPPTEVSDHDDASFHEDSSNIDSTDEDVRSHQKAKNDKKNSGMVDIVVHNQNWTAGFVESDFSDDVVDSDDGERMVANSTDDEDSEMRFPRFNEDTDMANPQFEIGMTFPSARSFRSAVKNQAISQRRAIIQKRNYGHRVRFVCEGVGCNWKIYGSPMPNSTTFQIKTLNNKHSCTQTFTQRQINSRWIAQYYENEIRMNPTWPLPAFHKKVVNDWKCNVSIHAIGRARRMALKNIKGDHVAEYALLWDYMNEIKKSMPESTVKLELEDAEPGEERRRFQRLYICLGPVKRGFKSGCRPLIGLDGCHLKGPYGMQLLSAVGADSNDGMYPIAWAVVEAENTDSWNWFLKLVADDVGIVNSGAWTFISDRQKGLINALENVVPNAEHRFCVMHLYNNMVKEHKGRGVRDLLWKAARASNEYMFNKHMTALKKISKRCHDWLMEKPRSQWSRSAFRTTCHSDMFVNNHCEVFNNSIGEFRDLPIIGLLQGIHKGVMRRIQTRRDKMLSSYQLNPVCPNAMRKVNRDLGFSGACVVQWSGDTKYLVTVADGGHEIVVDLDSRICACRKYDLTGLPCYHACACIRWKDLEMSTYIHKTYHKDMFLRTYQYTVQPINSQEYWEKTPYLGPLPPIRKIQPGRPKKKRNKKNDIPTDKARDGTKLTKTGTKVHCTYCKAEGHNARTCTAKKHDTAQAKSAKNTQDKGSTEVVSEGPVPSEGPIPTRGPMPSQGSTAPRPNKKKKIIPQVPSQVPPHVPPYVPSQVPNDQSQGGIFSCPNQSAKPTNTMKQLQKTRNDKMAALKKRDACKL